MTEKKRLWHTTAEILQNATNECLSPNFCGMEDFVCENCVIEEDKRWLSSEGAGALANQLAEHDCPKNYPSSKEWDCYICEVIRVLRGADE